MANHKNHSATIRSFDRSRMKYGCVTAMNDILELYREFPGTLFTFNDLLDTLIHSKYVLRFAMADLRRLGLITCVANEGDLRFQYSTASR